MAPWDVCTLLVVLSQLAQLVQSGAILEVQMFTYKNPSGRDWDNDKCDSSAFFGKWKCDTKLIFCFDRTTGNSDPESCAYKKATTGEFQNENEITFDHDMASVQNPIKFTINSWPGDIRFKVKIEDDDSFNGDDLIDLMNTVWRLTPARSVNQASWSRMHVTGKRSTQKTSLALNLRLYCQLNYYNRHCSQYCKASDGPRHYTCDSATGDKVCRPGWEGNLCDIRSDDCIDNKCTNGAICRDGYRQYTCECLAGFTGRFCETDIDDCASAPCLHDGRCVDKVAGYRCVCQTEYVGDRCSHHVCDSDQSPCLNGGTCYVLGGKARCICPKAFTGDVCEQDKCLDMTCLNQGTCVKGKCVCRPGFLGYYCSVDVCLVRPCLNGGTCDSGVCMCASGYSGLYCHQQTNECESDPCQHDGTCRDHVNGYSCDCLPAYNGTHCEHVIPTPPLPTYATVGPFTGSNDTDPDAVTGRDVTTPETLVNAGDKAKQRDTEAHTQAVQSKLDGIPVWLFVVIAGLVILVLLVLLIILVVMRRLKRKVSRAETAVSVHLERNGGETVTGINNPHYDDIRIAANDTCRYHNSTPPPYTATMEKHVATSFSEEGATGGDEDGDDYSKTGAHFDNPAYDHPPPARSVSDA